MSEHTWHDDKMLILALRDQVDELVAALNEARAVMNMPINMQQARRGQRAAMIEHIDAILIKAQS